MPEQHSTVTEIWRPISGNPGYEVSNLGRVRSLDRPVMGRWGKPRTSYGRILKQNASGRLGHLQVQFAYGKNHSVHRLVLTAFKGDCPRGMECAHLDGNPQNNRVENLEWKTHRQNELDKRRHGTSLVGERHPKTRLKEHQAREAYARCLLGEPRIRIAESFGVNPIVIESLALGKTWRNLGLAPIPCGKGNYRRFTKPGLQYGPGRKTA